MKVKLKQSGIEILDRNHQRVWRIASSAAGGEKPLERSIRTGQYELRLPAGLVVTDDGGARFEANRFELRHASTWTTAAARGIRDREESRGGVAAGETVMVNGRASGRASLGSCHRPSDRR